MRLGIFLCSLGLLAGLGAPAAAQAPDFANEIWPIFEARCVSCHGEKKQRGDLRLDTRAHIEAGGENGAIFTAGKPEESSLHNLIILPEDDPDIMPGSGDPLTAEQIDLVKRWIEGGADFGAWTEAAAPAPAGPAGPGKPTMEELLATLADGTAPAPEEALAKLRDAGALVLPLDQKTPLLRVDFNLQGDAITDEELALLAPVANQLTWLNLAKTKVSDSGLAALESLPKLTRLHLENTAIGDPALAHLAGLQHLRYLNLYGTKVTDAGLDSLAGLGNLEKVYLWQTGVTPEGAQKLAAAIPGVTTNLGEQLAPDPAPEEAKPEEEMKDDAPADEAPAEEKPAEEAPAAAPAPEKILEASLDEGSCCTASKADEKDCSHPCCVEAREKLEACVKCNPGAADFVALVKRFDAGGCCAAALAEAKKCDHPCCVEARDTGVVCAKCNPGAVATDDAPAAVNLFDEGSCCATAVLANKDCDHPCCVEARSAGTVCGKCNPNAKPAQEA